MLTDNKRKDDTAMSRTATPAMPRLFQMLRDLPRMIRMLLRDLLRGFSSVAESTEGFVEPVLPERVRRPLHSALTTIEGEGSRILNHRVDLSEVHSASAFLSGKSDALLDANKCAGVLAFAWERTRPTEDRFRNFLSETIAAFRLASKKEEGRPSGFDHAAAVFINLRRSHVAGRLPGLPISQSKQEQRSIDLKLFAFFVWLLANRADKFEEETRLLEMALALSRAFEDEVLESMDDQPSLAFQIQRLSRHL